MIGHLCKHPSIALRTWGSREAIGYLRQDSSNLAWHVQGSGEIVVQVSGEERILPSEPRIFRQCALSSGVSPISEALSRETGCAGSRSLAS
jgi:hypothetical protein